MIRRLICMAAVFAVLGVVGNASAFAPLNDKGHALKQQGNADLSHEKRQHKHYSGKDLVGDKIKINGTHKIQTHGKFTASVNVSNGKIAGVNVKHAEKGDVAVTKYKTSKQMAQGSTNGIRLASLIVAQAQYVGTVWIGYGYIDDYGDEIIYWFPYDMIFDGDTGAVEYYPS
jgi:hypothetical protein